MSHRFMIGSIHRLPEYLQQTHTVLGDINEFEQTLRQTRNHLTHPGIPKKSKVVTDGKGLFLFNQKMHALLRLLMLVHVRFPEEKVFRAVHDQSRKWR
jgi:Apea-like HEPN